VKGSLSMSYGRTIADDTYYGVILLMKDDGQRSLLDFRGVTFPRMMSRLASFIRDYEIKDVVLSRKEKEGSEYVLDEGTVALLRTDPAAAIRSMTHPHRIVKRKDRENISMSSSLLRTGHDTLADAFGVTVYFRKQEDQVECPACGRWKMELRELSTGPLGNTKTAVCDCGAKLLVAVQDRWACTDIGNLNGLRVDKYFLPRKWNEGGPWITHEALWKKYELFEEERDNAAIRA